MVGQARSAGGPRPACASTLKLGNIQTAKLGSIHPAVTGVELAHYGPHALRHACASKMLAEGLTLKEIGDHLGHRSTQSTATYTKVDLVALRQVGEFDLGGLQ